MYLIVFLALVALTSRAPLALTSPTWPTNWPIRRHPRIAHLMPYLRGDSLAAITFAARVLRRRFIDQNGQEDADGVVWILHWARLVKGGYRWHWTGQHDAHGREVRVRIPRGRMVDDCTTRYMAGVRSRKYGGRRPRTAEEHMARCARYGRILCLEGKGTLRTRKAYEYLAAAAVRTGCVVVFMTLQSIPGWRHRIRSALAVKFPVALLPRGAKPDDWQTFADAGVQVWGRWR